MKENMIFLSKSDSHDSVKSCSDTKSDYKKEVSLQKKNLQNHKKESSGKGKVILVKNVCVRRKLSALEMELFMLCKNCQRKFLNINKIKG